MLKNNFYILCEKFTTNNKFTKKLWNEIELSHSNKNRYYHTLSHLENIYTELNIFQLSHIVEFAIFYHDIIYNIQKKDNEEKSAILAVKRLTELGLSDTSINKIYQLILETKNHQSTSLENSLFLDADLSILGSKVEIYKKYIENIRKEYDIYSDKEYKSGRKKIIKEFLTKNRIYISNYFYTLYEEQARKNLEDELKLL